MAPPALAQAGLADRVFDAQSIFRATLDAMSHPGSVVTFGGGPAGLGSLASATNGLMLALADAQTPLWLAPSFMTDAIAEHLRFHCGCPIVADPAAAAFAVTGYDGALGLDRFRPGTPEYPDRSATVIVQVTGFGGNSGVTLRGPGIESSQPFFVDDFGRSDWRAVQTNNRTFPLGVDLILVAGSRIAAIPRSTTVEF